MYYKLKRNDLKKWLVSGHAKIYIPILILLCFMIYGAVKYIDVGSQDSMENDSSIAVASDEESTGSTTFVAANNSYSIKINKTKNFITIYKMDNDHQFTIVYKTFRCSVNADVPIAVSTIQEKAIWRLLATAQYGQYASKIGATFYIHSVPYSSESSSSLITAAYNNLGNTATIGSIYLSVADAKWIYENCGINTAVEVYENSAEEPAIALEEKVTLPFGTGYDPSDLEAKSKLVPGKINYMQGVNDKMLPIGASLNLLEGIHAFDTTGNDITSYISISGSANTAVAGQYTVTYNLMDSYGTILAYNSIITVYDPAGGGGAGEQTESTTAGVN